MNRICVFYRGESASHLKKDVHSAWCGQPLARLEPEPDRTLDGRACRACVKAMPKSHIAAVHTLAGWRVVRSGERYMVGAHGDEYAGQWLPDDERVPDGCSDIFTENEARLLLPFLRAHGHGRKAAAPTTTDGRLIDRACRKLGITVAGLGAKIGAHQSVLSRARHGELPEVHRNTIRAILKPQPKPTT